jgi:hypothetical protein
MRVAQGIIPSGLLCRDRNQRLDVRITAHYPIQSYEIRDGDLRGETHNITLLEAHETLMASKHGLFFGRLKERAGHFEVYRALDTALEQLVVQNADARAHVQECLGRDSGLP